MINLDRVLLSNALDVDALGTIILDPAQLIVYWNAWMVKGSKYAAQEVLNRPLFQVFPELANSRIAQAVENALRTGLPTTLSHRLNPPLFPFIPPPSKPMKPCA